MWKNYFTLAFRNIARHKGQSFINILGLSVGLAVAVLIMLYTLDELDYDHFHTNGATTYRINATSINPEGNFYRTKVPAPLGPAILEELPGIKNMTRIVPLSKGLIRVEAEEFYEDGIYMIDPQFFEIFSFKTIDSDPLLSLQAPNSVLISESMAKKYFGIQNPIGQSLELENRVNLEIKGIVKDPPGNTHLRFNFLISSNTPDIARKGWDESWENSTSNIYVQLDPQADPVQVESNLPAIVEKYMDESLDQNEEYMLSLQNIQEIYLNPHTAPSKVWAESNLKYLYIFPSLGLLILIIACINYTNLCTARGLERFKEISMRKILGATGSQINRQIMVESFALTILAWIIALSIVIIILPQYGKLTGKFLNLSQLIQMKVLLGSLILLIAAGLLSGILPSRHFSKLVPKSVSKGSWNNSPKNFSQKRNTLVIIQFIVAVVLMVSTIVVSKQLSFMQEKNLGYNKEQVMAVPLLSQKIRQQSNALKASWLQYPEIRSVSYSSGVPTNIGLHSTATWEGTLSGKALEVYHIMVDFDFVELYEFEIIDGRTFSKALSTDSTNSYVINESLAKSIGWKEPIGKKLSLWGTEGNVIGVIKDFHFKSLREDIGPVVFHFGPQWYNMASIKLSSDNIPKVIRDMETEWGKFSPERPMEFTFIDEDYSRIYFTEKRFGQLVQYFSILALALASLGLLGISAHVASTRVKEMGIRKVLGASFLSIIMLLSGRFMRLLVVALVFALPLSYLLMNRWLGGFAYHIKLRPDVFISVVAIMFLTVLATISYWSIRTARINPVETIKYE